VSELEVLLAAIEAMPPWPAPLPRETREHYIGVTLPLHRQDMETWRRDCEAHGVKLGGGDR